MPTTPKTATLVDLLRHQAERHGDKTAFTFSYNGDGEDATQLSYAELDARAQAIAANLQRQGAVGQRVLVFCRPGLDGIAGFFGALYAGAIAVPVHEKLAPRLSSVIPDARARFAVASPAMATKVSTAVDTLLGLIDERPLQWCRTDVPDGDAENWTALDVEASTIAMVQYTSGSTTAPKGVVLQHGNLLHNLEVMRQGWGGDENDVGVYWVPQHHDMGLIGGILEMLYVGCTTHLMSPSGFAQRPLRWLEALSRHRATITAAPNFAYQLCVDASSAAERAALDLSCWSVALIGSDPVRATTLRAFTEAFAPAGFAPETFRPAYGLAEATLLVSGGRATTGHIVHHLDRGALAEDRVAEAAPDDPAAAEVVGCGQLLGGAEVQVAIVDPETRRRCGTDEVGEIWVAGPSVAQGYLDKPAETERTFAAMLADAGAGECAGPFLRTGDLGYLRAGAVFITGRCKDLVVLDGNNHYPNDIEATVGDCHSALLSGRGAVFAVAAQSGGAEQLVICQETGRERVGEDELREIVDAIQAALSKHHRVQASSVVLMTPFRIPTTSSGKIQRGACREQFLERKLDSLAEWHAPVLPAGTGDPAQARLAEIVGEAVARRTRSRAC